jgi:hypothetical protein
MRFRWANAILLLLLLAEMASGLLGLVTGSEDLAIFIQAHRVAGYGILLILVWKAGNIAFSFRRARGGGPRGASLILLAMLCASLALGFTWALFGPFSFWIFSGMTWHIYIGVALFPVLAWHAIYLTRGFPVGYWADRRSFLRLAGIGVAAIASWQVAEVAVRAGGLSGAGRRFTGSYEAGSFSGNRFPRVSWLNDSPQPIDPAGWSLTVRGAVDRRLVIGYGDLEPTAEITATVDCTGGWHSTQVWRGLLVSDLLALSGLKPSARSVTVRSITGYYRRFSSSEIASYLLATHVGGEALSHGHGFPLRLAAPGKRGFEWVKWVTEIEVNESSKWLQPPLPLQ